MICVFVMIAAEIFAFSVQSTFFLRLGNVIYVIDVIEDL